MRTWTREEVAVFLDQVRGDRNAALYALALHTGMRRGELLGLRWEDVRWSTRTISVQTQAGMAGDEDDEEYEDEEAPTKTQAGRRAIKLDAEVVDVLRRHQEAQVFERRSWGGSYHDQHLVFCQPDGTRYHPDTLTGQFQRLARRAMLPRIRFHDMRHTHATLLLEAGIDSTVVSKRLGHASVKTTTDLYMHVTERLQNAAAERFSAYLAARDADPRVATDVADQG